MKVLVYGIGQRYMENRNDLNEKYEIVGLIDKDVNKQGKEIDGHIIMPPSEINRIDFDKIIVTPDFTIRESMRLIKNLTEVYGTAKEKIEFLSGFTVNPSSTGTEIKRIDTDTTSYLVALDSADTDDITNTLRKGNYNFVETRLVEMFKPLLGGVFFDLGANIGAFSLLMASHGWSGYAFEASSHNANLLKESISLNGYDISVINKAVYDYTGSLYFLEDGPWGLVRTDKKTVDAEEIPCVSLDDMIDSEEFKGLKKVDLIKMDIEGSKPAALRGMAGFLKKYCYPPIFMEINSWCLFDVLRETPASLLKLANEIGYKAYKIEDDNTLTLCKPTQFQTEINTDVLLMKDIPENFTYPIVEKEYPDDKYILDYIVNSLLGDAHSGKANRLVMVCTLSKLKDFPKYYQEPRIKLILDTMMTLINNKEITSNIVKALEWYKNI